MLVLGTALTVPLVLAACGLDVVGTFSTTASLDAGVEASLPPRDDDAAPTSDAPLDGGADAGAVDAEADRPDAGVPFVPTHVSATAYTLNAPAFSVAAASTVVVDTTLGTIRVDGAPAAASPHLRIDGSVAVLSAAAFDVSGRLEIRGQRPLVVVAAGDVTVSGTVAARATSRSPGPGGAAPGSGAGAGGAGSEAGGGGGAGHGQAGAAGGGVAANHRGQGGTASNPNGASLVGGAGGGRGGSASANACDAAGVGGAGGGAFQVSSLASVTIGVTGRVHLGGGGGRGGCRSNGGNTRTGGGGGGAGGLLYVEAVGNVTVAGFVDARGGGGGEGGGNNVDGAGGSDPDELLTSQAPGGDSAASGGAGGQGGVDGIAAETGVNEASSSGGGGGGIGRVVLKVRAPAVLDVQATAKLAAVRTDGAF